MTSDPRDFTCDSTRNQTEQPASSMAEVLEPPKALPEVPSPEPCGKASAKEFEEVEIFGLPIARMTSREVIDQVDRMIAEHDPGFFVTANLHYARLCHKNPALQKINRQAAFLTADGMPLVWWSRWLKKQLPERVTGADLVFEICRLAARKQYRVFLFGGLPEVTHRAAEKLQFLNPTLQIVGIETPQIDQLTEEEEKQLFQRIRDARPDLLLVALGQPKGEFWLAKHHLDLGVPAGTQLGATFDFLAGRVRRAPRWMQKIGAEWLFRTATDPRRMVPRYFQDGLFLIGQVVRGLFRRGAGRSQ